MMNSKLNCCLWLLIVCNKRIKISFKGSDGVSLVWEIKIEMLKFNILKSDSNDDGEFLLLEYVYFMSNKPICNWNLFLNSFCLIRFEKTWSCLVLFVNDIESDLVSDCCLCVVWLYVLNWYLNWN